MKVGLVGKPNAGKSTFFNAVTSAVAQIGDYPFTTIDKNVGIAHVRKPCPSEELGLIPNPNNSLSEDGIRYIPIEVIDVAGLVPGAHEGKGMGNKFLDDLRQADVLIHVVDSSGKTDLEGNSVELADPLEEISFLENELHPNSLVASILFDFISNRAIEGKGSRNLSPEQRFAKFFTSLTKSYVFQFTIYSLLDREKFLGNFSLAIIANQTSSINLYFLFSLLGNCPVRDISSVGE